MVGRWRSLVLVEPDFGTAALLGVMLFAMLFAGGCAARSGAAVLPIVPLAVYAISSSPIGCRRVMVFLDPWEHPRDAGFQLLQSFIAFGSGGLLGAGLGESKQKMFYLPEAHTDFIFSVIGEELGLIGARLMVGLFALLAVRGLAGRARHPTVFGQLSPSGDDRDRAAGRLNMAVVLGCLPTKGLALAVRVLRRIGR